MVIAAAIIGTIALIVVVVVRPKAWLPAYLFLLPIAPQVAVGNVPLSITNAVFVAGLVGVICYKILRHEFTMVRTPLVGWTALLLLSFFFSSLNAGVLWGNFMMQISLMKFIRIFEAFAVMFLATEVWSSKLAHPEPVEGRNSQLATRDARLFKWILLGAAGGAVLGLISTAHIDWFYALYKAERNFGFQIWIPGFTLRRAVGVFLDPNHLSSYLSMSILLAAILWTRKELAISRTLLVVTLAVCSAALLLTFSRAGWLMLLVSVCVYVVMSKDFSRSRKLAIMLGIGAFLVIALVAVSALFPGVGLGLMSRVLSTFDQASVGDWNAVTSTRLTVWQTGLAVFARYPIFGTGYKVLPELFLMGDNNYLTMLAEGGIVGAGIWGVWLIAMTVYVYKLARVHWLGQYLFSIWVAILINMVTADFMTYWRTLPLFFAILGISFVVVRRTENRE